VNNLVGATSLEPVVIDVATASADEKQPFVERSRDDIFDDAVNNISSTYICCTVLRFANVQSVDLPFNGSC
jgi:hypothetical protein